jgi:hypothetical protein
MTYTQFVQDVEKSNKIAAKYGGIYIVEDSAQPFFSAIVREALGELYNKPTGKALLDAIDNTAPADNRGYKVLIQRVEISYKMVVHDGEPRGYKATPSGGRSFASGAQQRLGVTSAAASNGQGVSTIVGWCQNQISYTSKVGASAGKSHYVPPPVTIGHELIHALHALTGTLKSGTLVNIGGKDVSAEEAQTVGLGAHSSDALTENRLRQEFNLPARLSYP